jgi:hypothetical protein
MVLGEFFEMLRQGSDPFREKRYLHLRGTGVIIVGLEILDN